MTILVQESLKSELRLKDRKLLGQRGKMENEPLGVSWAKMGLGIGKLHK
jgi:hypothetical protein